MATCHNIDLHVFAIFSKLWGAYLKGEWGMRL